MNMSEILLQYCGAGRKYGMTIDNRYYLTLRLPTDKNQDQSVNNKVLTMVLTSVHYTTPPSVSGHEMSAWTHPERVVRVRGAIEIGVVVGETVCVDDERVRGSCDHRVRLERGVKVRTKSCRKGGR